MTSSLFRDEAIAHQQAEKMGDVFAVKTLSLGWLTGFFVVQICVLVCFIVWGEYTRKAHVVGFLSPNQGMLKVYTTQPGTVIEQHVIEGQAVKQGDVLFVLSAEHASLENPDAQASAIEQIQQRRDSLLNDLEKQDSLNQIQVQDLQTKEKTLAAELLQISKEVELRQQRTDSAATLLKKYQDLLAQHYVAEIQVRQKQDELLAQSGDLQNLKRSGLSLERDLANVKSELAGSRYKFAQQRAELERAISTVEQELTEYQAKRSMVITAPKDGTATAILIQPGQVASTQTPLLSILPKGAQLQAHLLVPSRSIGFVAKGQAVALRYQAFPFQRFGSHSGTVDAVSKSLISANEADFPVKLDEPAYRVVVNLPQQAVAAYQQQMPLQAGMLLEADIKLEQRRLIDWVFDPLYSMAGKL